jgi:hypothetical protein
MACLRRQHVPFCVLDIIRHLLLARTVCRSVGTQSDSLAASGLFKYISRISRGITNCRLDMQQARTFWGLYLIKMGAPSLGPFRRNGVSRINPSLPGASHGSRAFTIFVMRNAMLKPSVREALPLQKLPATVRCRPNCSGGGSCPGPTACNAVFFENSMHSLIQRLLCSLAISCC